MRVRVKRNLLYSQNSSHIKKWTIHSNSCMGFYLFTFSIYEKLIEHCGIDEKGTNYPPELYDPSIWGKESYYDALGRWRNKR